MLFEFLNEYKEKIIQLCREKVLAAGESKPTPALLDRGLPISTPTLLQAWVSRFFDLALTEA